MPNPHVRYEILDGMRGVAAICVMLSHFLTYLNLKLFNTGDLAVDFFFILSGFVLAKSYGNRLYEDMSIGEYAIRRWIRLYPMFIAGLVLGSFSLYLLIQNQLAGYTNGMLLEGLLMNSFYLPYFNHVLVQGATGQNDSLGPIFPTNPPSWSLLFEAIASVAFVFLCRLKTRMLTVFVAINFFWLVAMALVLNDFFSPFGFVIGIGMGTDTFIGGFPRVFYSFALGLLLYRARETIAAVKWIGWLRKWSSHSYVIYALLVATFINPKTLKGSLNLVSLLTVAPYLVHVGSEVVCNSRVSLKTAVFLGWISYPLYCVHYPIGRIVFLLASKYNISNTLALVAAVLLSMLTAIVLTKIYDQPIRTYLLKHLGTLKLNL